MTKSRRLKQTEVPTEMPTHRWPPTTERPENDPSVLLLFHGLLGLAYNDEVRIGEIGFLANAKEHRFRVTVLELEGKEKRRKIFEKDYGPAQNVPCEFIRLDVVMPNPRGVKYYMPTGYEITPGVGVTSAQDGDIRLIPDLESDNFYSRKLMIEKGAFRPRMFIKHGVFVSLEPTRTAFKRVAPNDALSLGYIPQFIGCLIYLEKGGYVAIRIGNKEIVLDPTEGRKYVVSFSNSCLDEDCTFDPKSARKERRNDFRRIQLVSAT